MPQDRAALYVADYGGPYSGNFLKSALSLADELKGVNLRLILVLPAFVMSYSWYTWIKRSIACEILPANQSILGYTRYLRSLVERHHVVLLHSHFTTFDIPIALAALGSFTARPAVIWHARSDFRLTASASRSIKDWVKFRCIAPVGRVRVVALSEGLRAALVRRGLAASRITVIPNGIESPCDAETMRSRSRIRDELGIPPSSKVVLAFGWGPETKAIDVCLDACQELVAAGLDLRLIIVGTDRLQRFVRSWAGGKTPTWLHIERPREHVGEFYSAADAFFGASRGEGFSNSVAEALACRLPAIISRIPGLQWAAQVPGAVDIDPGNPRAAADAIRTILGWPDAKRASLGTVGAALIQRDYSLKSWARRITDLYTSVLSDRRCPS